MGGCQLNKKGFALAESLLLFAGAVLLCVMVLSSISAQNHFQKLKNQFDFKSEDERLEALYE